MKSYGNVSPLFGSMKLRKMKQWLGRILIPQLPMTRHVFNHIRWELRAIWVRINNTLNPLYIYQRKKIRRKNDLSVVVACGGTAKRGWVNFDLMRHKDISLRYDCRKGLPLRENSVIRIRCEHFFEHLEPQEEAPSFLKSCYRCLKKGGILRIIVPDAERFLRAYQTGNSDDWAALGWDLNNLPQGFYTQLDIINHVFRQCEEHMYAYDFETLELSLRRAGFNNTYKCTFGDSRDPGLGDDSIVHKPYSLYVEAVK